VCVCVCVYVFTCVTRPSRGCERTPLDAWHDSYVYVIYMA